MRSIAIGDIHGRLDLLEQILTAFPERTFVFLGDYTDRGPDSPGVVARIRELVETGRAVALMGNHDEMLINVVLNGEDDQLWMENGGRQTVEQYSSWSALTEDALWMRDNLRPWHIEGAVLFAHAMRPHKRDADAHLWGRPNTTPIYPLPAGVQYSVHGHTPMKACPFPIAWSDGSTLWFIDTGAVWTGKLGALDCETMQAHVVGEAQQ